MATFEELGVNKPLLRAIEELGYLAPMPIQEMVIPHLLHADSDVVGLAQTGTGKTAAFGLPTLQRVQPEAKTVQALILDPTRELCLQTCADLNDYARYLGGVDIVAVYGGASIMSQIREIKGGPQIVVATPGRLIDLLDRGALTLSDVRTVILDEADEMLNMGFVDDINNILEHVPATRKMLMFSATMPREIAEIASKYMHNPQEFVVGTRNEGSANVKHVYYMVNARDKYMALKRIVDYLPRVYGIIFCRTRATCQEIASQLIQDGYDADALHGDLSQAQRDAVMKKFRERNLQLLVATDVAARGLDVDDLTHIISYSLPDDNDVYTHRSGRTGRAGKTGVSIAIIHSRERRKLHSIEKQIGKEFQRREVPKAREIIEKQLFNLADRLENVQVHEDDIAEYLPAVLKKLSWLSTEELLKRLLSVEFNRLIEYYNAAPVLDVVPEEKKRDRASREKKRLGATSADRVGKNSIEAQPGYERVYVNAGKAQGLYAPDIISLINANTRGQRIELGRIDLLANYALFDVKSGEAHRVVSALRNQDFYGTRLYCEVAQPGKDYDALSQPTGKELTRIERRRKRNDVYNEKKRDKQRREQATGRGRRGKARREATMKHVLDEIEQFAGEQRAQSDSRRRSRNAKPRH